MQRTRTSLFWKASRARKRNSRAPTTPVRANADDLKRFHGTNERLSIEGYADMIRFYRRLIENTAG
jgi:acetylornithine deacetylase/succinyl-diaminopimelate desuccinylase-like protein